DAPVYFIAVCSDASLGERHAIDSIYVDAGDDLLQAIQNEQGEMRRSLADLTALHGEHEELIRGLREQLRQSDEALSAQRAAYEGQLLAGAEELREHQRQLQEKAEQSERNLRRLAELEAQLEEHRGQIAERDRLLQERELLVSDYERRLEDQARESGEREQALEAQLDVHRQQLAEQGRQLQEKGRQLSDYERRLDEQARESGRRELELNAQLEEHRRLLAEQGRELEEKERQLADRLRELGELQTEMATGLSQLGEYRLQVQAQKEQLCALVADRAGEAAPAPAAEGSASAHESSALSEAALLREIEERLRERDPYLRAKDLQVAEVEQLFHRSMADLGRSGSYRIGRFLTWPLRAARNFFAGVR
ncbi:MAG: hypothetical protein M3348_13320, partial [Acidobacteriota bacterium]|nr:hypothetical protein [Acidobacteriota bacterium]